ncbi:MAG: zinc ribbon domain-containing protein [Azoarcus sp.]|jgi:hypothetical protein|nr:zinc ribbon domain-containing protein [Azoarcus sp.]
MSQDQSEPRSRYSNVPRAAEALRNEKALFVLLVTGLLAGGLMFLADRLASPDSFSMAGLSIFIALIVFPAGGATAGLLLMDQARGQKPRPLRKAIFDATGVALRLFIVFLAAVAAAAVFCLVLALLIFACKIPIAGPALYAALFPAMSALGGLLLLSLYAAMAMAGPAILSGASVSETFSTLWNIASSRAGELLVDLFLLSVFVGVSMLMLVGIFVIGCQIVLEVSALIVGGSFKLQVGVFSLLPPAAANDVDAQYMLAFVFGSQIGLALVATAIVAMALMGANLIYLRLTKDLLPAEVAWNARTTAQPNRQEPASHAIPNEDAAAGGASDPYIRGSLVTQGSLVTERPLHPLPEACPHCQAAIQPGDHFCGECGGKIPG